MKIGLYNPYLDSFGGGERYTLTLAGHWSKSHDVHVFWDDPDILAKSEERFHIPLANVSRDPNIFRYPLLKKFRQTGSYDLLFVLSDGSIPVHAGKKGILHFQVPFPHVEFPFLKRFAYQSVVCNSEFTKKNLDPSLPMTRSVIYPPVRVNDFHEGKKTRTILSVGRFNGHYDAKKQDVLISAFRRGIEKNMFDGWKLIFAGSRLSTDTEFFGKLKKEAQGLPISFFPNCSFDELTDLYAGAGVYWHAAGFGEENPEHMEHFGMTTVEAMASGCVPIVFAGGGQTEIVTDKETGYLWSTPEELLEKTKKALNGNGNMAQKAILRAHDFSENRFTEAFDTLLTDL